MPASLHKTLDHNHQRKLVMTEENRVPLSLLVLRREGRFLLLVSKADQRLLLDTLLPRNTTPDGLDRWVRIVKPLLHSYYQDFLDQHKLEVLNGTEFLFYPDDGWMVSVSDSYESYSSRHVTLEFDLDHMLLLYGRFPVCHLDRPPPRNLWRIFQRCNRTYAAFAYWRFYEEMPGKFVFDLGRLQAPRVENTQLVFYERHFDKSRIVTTPRDVLSAPEKLSGCEETRLHFAAMHAEFYVQEKLRLIYQDIAFVDSWKNIGWNGREIACLLAAVTLVPLHILGPPSDKDNSPWHRMFSQAANEFWYIRKHICVTLATHLSDERNAQYHISRLVQAILSTSDQGRNARKVVYGVVFSLFHCIVVRVDTGVTGTFTRTELLEFLSHPSPSQPAPRWHTPGLELLVRLGNLRAPDDMEFFHRNLSSRWWKGIKCKFKEYNPPRRRTPTQKSRAFPRGPRLPVELLFHIAAGIEDPNTLCDFALVSTATMRAAIPRLRLPQLRGHDLAFSKQPYLPLRTGLIVEDVELAAPPTPCLDALWQPTMFGVRYLDMRGIVMIQPEPWTRWFKDSRTDGRFLDMLQNRNQTIPRATLRYYATSGRERPAGTQSSEIPDVEDPVAYWKHNRRYFFNPHPKLSFMMGWLHDRDVQLTASGYDADDERS